MELLCLRYFDIPFTVWVERPHSYACMLGRRGKYIQALYDKCRCECVAIRMWTQRTTCRTLHTYQALITESARPRTPCPS